MSVDKKEIEEKEKIRDYLSLTEEEIEQEIFKLEEIQSELRQKRKERERANRTKSEKDYEKLKKERKKYRVDSVVKLLENYGISDRTILSNHEDFMQITLNTLRIEHFKYKLRKRNADLNKIYQIYNVREYPLNLERQRRTLNSLEREYIRLKLTKEVKKKK